MRQAEEIIFDKISHAFECVSSISNEFECWQDIPDDWIEQSDAFLWAGNDDELFLLPAFLTYLLRHIDKAVNGEVWLNIELALREFSKQKKPDSFKMTLTNKQFLAIKSFIKHISHNIAYEFDKEDWLKTLESWQR